MSQKNLEGELLIINQKYWLYESAISKKQCELILSETDWSVKHTGEFMRDGQSVSNEDIRETSVTFVPPHSVVGCILNTHLLNINAYQWNYNITRIQDVQIGHYKKDGHYDWHVDVTAPDEHNMQRKLSAVLMLSEPDEYEGGLLEIKDVEMPVLKQGTLIVFPSFMKHRVTKVTKGNRFTAVAWAVGPAFR
jgi:PKHD-type hydroxylase